MKNADKPAFIVPIENLSMNNQINLEDCNGLTKREYFAAMAMQGIISNPQVLINVKNTMIEKGIPRTDDGKIPISSFVKLSIDIVDELLKQLENGK